MKAFRLINKIVLAIIFIFTLSSCSNFAVSENSSKIEEKVVSSENGQIEKINEDSPYYSMEDVAEYIHLYNKLPKNYISKKQAQELGWNPKEGNLWSVTDKAVIGGDHFGNYEKNLPDADYKEADVNYYGGRRNAERLVFDSDGNIYYSNDHYESFERIY